MECLGYYKATVKEQPTAILSLPIGENGAQQDVPVRIVCNRTDGSPQLYVMDIPTLVSASDDTDAETGLQNWDWIVLSLIYSLFQSKNILVIF